MAYIDAPAGFVNKKPDEQENAKMFTFKEQSTMMGTFLRSKNLIGKKDKKPYTLYFFATNTGTVMISEHSCIKDELRALIKGQNVVVHDTGEEKEVGQLQPMRVFQIFVQE